eukprot:7635783-Karenia_brevis.AAC.1
MDIENVLSGLEDEMHWSGHRTCMGMDIGNVSGWRWKMYWDGNEEMHWDTCPDARSIPGVE